MVELEVQLQDPVKPVVYCMEPEDHRFPKCYHKVVDQAGVKKDVTYSRLLSLTRLGLKLLVSRWSKDSYNFVAA